MFGISHPKTQQLRLIVLISCALFLVLFVSANPQPAPESIAAQVERVGKYLIRPLRSLDRLSLDEREGKVGYRYGQEAEETERMDYLEFIARVVSQFPDKGQVKVRYYGLYANAHRGKIKKASLVPASLGMIEEELRPMPSKGWAEMIRKVYEVDPLVCFSAQFDSR